MPITRVPSREAIANSGELRARWPKRGAADNRIEPIAKPAFDPTFSFSPGATIFTMGSCFARHVEDALLARGFRIPTRAHWIEETAGLDPENSMLNNFGVPALYNELRWALGVGAPYDPKTQLFEVYPGKFADVHLPRRLRLCSYEEAIARRERIFELNKSICTADVAIFTLGVAEVWFDRQTGVHLNTRPYETVIRAAPERFELHVLDYEDIYRQLDDLFSMVFAHCTLKSGVILTISPIPLTATYTSQDVAVANQYSKSVLRAAAGAITQKYARIDYFPSYESVILSDRFFAWDGDLIHATQSMIDVNVGRLIEGYVGQEVAAPDTATPPIAEEEEDAPPTPPPTAHPVSLPGEYEDIVKSAKSLMRQKQWSAAMASVQDLSPTSRWVEPLRIIGECQLQLGRPDLAEAAFRSALALRGTDGHSHGGLGMALKAQGRVDEAIAALSTCIEYSNIAAWPIRLADTLFRAGRIEEARTLVERSILIWRDHPALLRLRKRLEERQSPTIAASDSRRA